MAVKAERLDVRVSRKDKRLIEKAAQVTGQPVTSFVLASALESAREAIERERKTVLSERDWKIFLRILEDEAPPPPALVRALRLSGGNA